MSSKKRMVALFGASGTMGFEAFKNLWERRAEWDISLLLLPRKNERKRFAPYQHDSSVSIVWGDAVNYSDVRAAVRGCDAVLCSMAFISPAADYDPDTARKVNTQAIQNIIHAICEEPDGAGRIIFAYTGTVAETGDRRPPIHWGRVGDPINPSIYDFYASTKIAGERAVLESELRYWVSLRMTYIMPTRYADYRSLLDPIMFHMPLDSCMENISDRDAGYGLVRCLDVPLASDFWRRAYNMGGGPAMRMSAYEYLDASMKFNGVSGIQAVSERRWFALKNFHMQYYEDSDVTNSYLGYQRDSFSDCKKLLHADMPRSFKFLMWLSKHTALFRAIVQAATKKTLSLMAKFSKNGTAYWAANKNEKRLKAFFGSRADYDAIPDWTAPLPRLERPDSGERKRLHHGYDESKPRLDIHDVRSAAEFRGGQLVSSEWRGGLYESLEWKCAFGHHFAMKPYTVLKAGHWCPDCESPPWRGGVIAAKNHFFAQVWNPFHKHDENEVYEEKDIFDIIDNKTTH